MALGLKYGYRNLAEFPNYKILKKKQAEFDRRFKAGVGSLYCKEILRGNYGVPEEREQIYAEERYRVCALVTAYAVTILDLGSAIYEETVNGIWEMDEVVRVRVI